MTTVFEVGYALCQVRKCRKFKKLLSVPVSGVGDGWAFQGVVMSILPVPCCLWTTMLGKLSNLQVPAVCLMGVWGQAFTGCLPVSSALGILSSLRYGP